MIEWKQIMTGLNNAFASLISSGLENVRAKEVVADLYILIETFGTRETLILLDSLGLPNRILEKFPLSYDCCGEFAGQRITFPIVSGSCLDFYERNKAALEKAYFCFFYSSREESIKRYRQKAMGSLKNGGFDEASIVFIPIAERPIKENYQAAQERILVSSSPFSTSGAKDFWRQTTNSGFREPRLLM